MLYFLCFLLIDYSMHILTEIQRKYMSFNVNGKTKVTPKKLNAYKIRKKTGEYHKRKCIYFQFYIFLQTSGNFIEF